MGTLCLKGGRGWEVAGAGNASGQEESPPFLGGIEVRCGAGCCDCCDAGGTAVPWGHRPQVLCDNGPCRNRMHGGARSFWGKRHKGFVKYQESTRDLFAARGIWR